MAEVSILAGQGLHPFILVARNGHLIGTTGRPTGGKTMVTIERDAEGFHHDVELPFQMIAKVDGDTVRRAILVDITDHPGLTRLVKSDEIPSWLDAKLPPKAAKA